MKKIEINKEAYLNYYNMGLSDLKISKIIGISNSILSKFRQTLKLPVNRPKFTQRSYTSITISDEFYQVLLGTIIGDGSLELDTNCKAKNARLRFGHCRQQLDYLKFKVSLLPGLWKSDIRQSKTKVEISSISHPLLTQYYNKFYIGSKKVLCLDELDKLTAFGLAIIFMDDGSRDKRTNAYYISLSSFTEDENRYFCELLKHKFGIDSIIVKKGKIGKKYMHIYIRACSRELFKNLIRPYIIPSMLYKIGE